MLTLLPGSASALSCVEFEGRERSALKNADVAFAGQVVSTRKLPSLATMLVDQDSLDDTVFTFRVRRVYKGRVPTMVDVVGMSQYPLGERARAILAYDRGDGDLGSSPCSEVPESDLQAVASTGRKPDKGRLRVSRWRLLEPIRVAFAISVAVFAIGVVAVALVLVRRLRRRRLSRGDD